MELLDGVTLQQLVEREGPLPAARVLAIVRQLCAALDAVHRGGLVHRDAAKVSAELERVVLDCLEKEPSARPASARWRNGSCKRSPRDSQPCGQKWGVARHRDDGSNNEPRPGSSEFYPLRVRGQGLVRIRVGVIDFGVSDAPITEVEVVCAAQSAASELTAREAR